MFVLLSEVQCFGADVDIVAADALTLVNSGLFY